MLFVGCELGLAFLFRCTYTYDADGNRVEKSNGSTGTLYWYMSPGIVAESNLSGNLTSEYVFFDGERMAHKDFPNNAVEFETMRDNWVENLADLDQFVREAGWNLEWLE